MTCNSATAEIIWDIYKKYSTISVKESYPRIFYRLQIGQMERQNGIARVFNYLTPTFYWSLGRKEFRLARLGQDLHLDLHV